MFFEQDSEADVDTVVDAREGEEETLHCSACGHEVTARRHRISIEEAHEHTFVNPGGYVFHIGCFERAPGCLQVGEPTEQNTWFRGHAWSYALCGSCFAHLGWVFQRGEEQSFFGLILNRLASR